MSFPLINFKSSNTELGTKLPDVVTQKFASLEKYIGDETDVQCDVEFEKVAEHQSGRIYRVEANLWCRGQLYRAEATEESFDKAVDEVRDELDKELRRATGKRESMLRKGGRKLKEMLRFGE